MRIRITDTTMLQCFLNISVILLVSVNIYAMHVPSLKQIAIKKAAEFAAHDLSYYIKALDSLSPQLNSYFTQQLVLINKNKSALPIMLLGYKLHQQQQLDSKQYKLRLLLAHNQQVQLTLKQSSQIIQASATIQNLIQDLEEQIEEIPLPLLTQEQITNLLPYISITHALNISNNTLPMLQQEIPETVVLSSYYLKFTALRQLKYDLTTKTIPTLCNLIIAASYLDMQNGEHTINFIEIATQALANKLLQLPQHQNEYDVIHVLPAHIQRMLARYIIDYSAVRYVLCSNSTDVITNTAQTLTGHKGLVSSISWSHDGKYIASCSNDRTARIWNANTSTCIYILKGHTNNVWSVIWSPDGKYIASSSEDGTVRIWDAITGTCIHTLEGHTNNVWAVVWSPDGKYVASKSQDATIRVWNAITGTCIYTLNGSYGGSSLTPWSPDSRYIASCSFDSTIKIWDITNGTCIRTLKGHTHWVYSVSWSPDNSMLASGSWDTTIRVWDITTGTCIHTLEGHTDSIYSLSWSPNGKYIASGSRNNIIKVWDAVTSNCIYTLTGHMDAVISVSWSSDGKYIASSSEDGTVRIWDASIGTCIHMLTGYYNTMNSISWSPNGCKLAGGCHSTDYTVFDHFTDYMVKVCDIINTKLHKYLEDTLSWEQALLLVRIISQQDIDFVHDIQAYTCYASLPEDVKQLLSKNTCATLTAAFHDSILHRDKRLRIE